MVNLPMRDSLDSNSYFPIFPCSIGKREPKDVIDDEVLNAKREKLEESTVQAETKVVNEVDQDLKLNYLVVLLS